MTHWCLWILVHLAAGSPCDDRYAAWVTDREAFQRDDEPRYLSGLHVVCVWKEAGTLRLEAHMNGVLEEDPVRSELDGALSLDWGKFRKSLQGVLRFSKATNEWGNFHLKQPYGIFSEAGHRLSSATEVLDAGLVLVVEGGQWFWPPVRIGYVRGLPGTPYMIETVSVQPVVFRVRGFLREEECSVIIDMAESNMSESPVVQMEKHYRDNDTKDFRTSTQARLPSSDSSLLQELDKRISNLTRVDVTHNEEVQVLRYRLGEFYASHTDNFDPEYYQNVDFIDKGHRNRLLTVFWYLTNVSKGGETLFPRADGLPPPEDMNSCERGLKVRPEVGTVMLWYSLRPNGNGDPNSLHASCPVEDGKKWSANYWVWNKPRDFSISLPDADVDEEYSGEQSVALSTVEAGNNVSATFRNEHPFPMYLFWKPPDRAQEAFLGEISPQAAVSMLTFPGHIWHIRIGADQSSELVTAQVITDQPKQVIVLSSDPEPDVDEL
ncbi:unnamed protein product [Effrenium voratum]|uniref:Fe2OG dioxygenase domain-containing protein n=1 Tax=Effrenium voratum TaxID=2562239 RepID=A0AA36IT91_9DINO|nr:unnamed protein product [Effrenium voratum]